MWIPNKLIALSQNTSATVIGPVDPRTMYTGNYTLPDLSFPVLQGGFDTPPDCGETSYVGRGRLAGRKALVTDGDSGIGRAVAIAFA